ncbi:hypothetical protein MRX96_005259 [Rhipicephalus microplus]
MFMADRPAPDHKHADRSASRSPESIWAETGSRNTISRTNEPNLKAKSLFEASFGAKHQRTGSCVAAFRARQGTGPIAERPLKPDTSCSTTLQGMLRNGRGPGARADLLRSSRAVSHASAHSGSFRERPASGCGEHSRSFLR